MLVPILATDDPYQAAQVFRRAGWRIDFETPRDCDDPLAGVSLAGDRLLLGTSLPEFLPPEARSFRGAGVTLYLVVDPAEIEAIYERHAAAGVSTRPLNDRPFGMRAFNAELAGFRFLIAAPGERNTDPGAAAHSGAATGSGEVSDPGRGGSDPG